MKAVILAAGQGTRLRPLTDDRPKCMVEYAGTTLIKRILSTIRNAGIDDIAVVAGYEKDVLAEHLAEENLTVLINRDYKNTNMVHSFFEGRSFYDDDLVISYSDIQYTPGVIEKLIESTADVAVAVDEDWKKLWLMRMERPLDDAETLKYGPGKKIAEIGKKATSYDEIQGQYIGLLKISRRFIPSLFEFYDGLSPDGLYEGQPVENMYMTTLLQLLIDNFNNVEPVVINGGWLEIDSIQDMEKYTRSNYLFSELVRV